VKITVITGANGQLVAIAHAHLSEHDRLPRVAGAPHATLLPQAGQVFHELVAPEEFRREPHDALRRWVLGHLAAGAK
jgi:hypothetical protein